VEGAVLDLWMPDMSRLQSRQDYIAGSVVCDKSLRPRFPASGHQDSIASKLPESEFVRLSNARATSKINSIATAFEYGRQAGPSRLESVTREGAAAEIVCHADL
jgi:hypothetical protein